MSRKYLWNYFFTDIIAWNMFIATLLAVVFVKLVPTLATSAPNLTTVSHDEDIWQNTINHLKVSSIIFGLSKLASEEQLSRQCFQELKSIERGIIAREPWAMKVLDASGAKDSGFIWGQNFWLGSPEGCAAAQSPLQVSLSNRYKRKTKDGLIAQTAPFHLDYRVAHVEHDSPWQMEIKLMTERIIHIGLCLPSSCSSAEIQNLTQTFLNENVLMKFYDLQAEVLYIKDLKLKDSFFDKISFKIITGVVLFTLAMMIAARCLPGDGKDIDKDGALTTFIKCFDIVSNGRALFALEENTPNSIPVINGLRSVSCFWIIIPHVAWFAYYTVNNKAIFAYFVEKFSFQYMNPSIMLVDLFFTISGFLQTYNFMRNKEEFDAIRQNTLGANLKTFGRMLFHRYLRLAPLYLVLIVMLELSTSHAQDVSYFHLHDRYDQLCSNHWWRNIIFIQNLFDVEEMCLNWSWSLACDMQYFCLISMLLFVYTKHPRLSKNIVIGCVVSTMAWTYCVGLRCRYKIMFDVGYNTGTDMYINPTVRVVPYLLGSIAGWWLVQNGGQFSMGKTLEKGVWIVSGSVFLICMFITLIQDSTSLEAITRFLFGRMAFSLVVCWMIIASATGRRCWWSRILEHKFFQHFSRLSYAIYLLNPFVITLLFGMSNTSSHADSLMLLVLACGFMVVVYLASVVFSLAFEIPYSNWSRALTKRSKKLKAI